MGRKQTYKLGPVQNYRKFPDGYHSMSKSEKAIIDSEFKESIKDKSVKSRHLFYYAEIIWDDEMYVTHLEKTKEYINKAKRVHGNTYDYSLVNYITNMNQIKIICPVHGEFEQRADNHLQGKGCFKCGLKKTHESNLKKKEALKNKEKVRKKKREQEGVLTLFDEVPIEKPKAEAIEEKRFKDVINAIKAKKVSNRIKNLLNSENTKSRIEERKEEKKIQAEYGNKLISDLMSTIAKRANESDTEIPDIIDSKDLKEGINKPNINKQEEITELENGVSPEFTDFLAKLKEI